MGTHPATGGVTARAEHCPVPAGCGPHALALGVLLPLRKEAQRRAATHPKAQTTGPGIQGGGQKQEAIRTCVTVASRKGEGVPEVGIRRSWAPGLSVLGSYQP